MTEPTDIETAASMAQPASATPDDALELPSWGDVEGDDAWKVRLPELLVRDDGAGVAQPVLYRGTTGAVVAAGGVGKSQWCIQLGVAVATGGEFMGLRVKEPGRVLLVFGEDPKPIIHHRLQATIDRTVPMTGGFADDDLRKPIRDNLHILARAGEPSSLVLDLDRGGGAEDRYGATEFANSVFEALDKGGQWSLVCIDPGVRFMPPDGELSSHAASAFIAQLERFASAPGSPAVLFTHHTRKSSRDGGDGVNAARGSGALTDNVRTVFTLKRDGPLGVVMRHDKGNYVATMEPMRLFRDVDAAGSRPPLLRAETGDDRRQRVRAEVLETMRQKAWKVINDYDRAQHAKAENAGTLYDRDTNANPNEYRAACAVVGIEPQLTASGGKQSTVKQ